MYAKKIRILNCRPIEDVDITFPFNEENPKPILLVGEDDSGKRILLPHIVNGLMVYQKIVYSESSDVDKGKACKYRYPD